MIDLQALTDEEIVSRGLTELELWFLRHGEEVVGPFLGADVQAWAKSHPELAADADVRCVAEEHWVMYLQSSLKASAVEAKPRAQLLEATTLVNNLRYYYERLGHRQGPHGIAEMKELLTQGKLTLTDLVSYDEGLTWHKIYQLKEFEDRPHRAEQLPPAPLESVWQHGHGEALLSLTEEEDPIKEGLVSLAYLGQHQKPTALKIEEMELPRAELAAPQLPPKWWLGASLAATAMLAVLVWWAQAPGPVTEGKLTTSEELSAGEKSKVTKAPQRRPSGGGARRQNIQRAPASLMPRAPSPPAMRDARSGIMNYQELHERDPRDEVNNEPMDVDPYGADQQYVQDEGQDSLMRRPQSVEAPDDGYRLEEPAANETGPVVEEVGDF